MISGFDLRDAQVGKSVAYEFDVEIDNKFMPFKLLEDVNRWEYADFVIFQMEHQVKPGEGKRLVEKKQMDDQMPVLAPFQLAAPMELWIQNAKDMRISLPEEELYEINILLKFVSSVGTRVHGLASLLVYLVFWFNNSSSVQPVISLERTVFYREKAAGMYSPFPFVFAQGLAEIPYILVQTIIYGIITYFMINFERMDEMIVDNCSMQLIFKPEQFDVMIGLD